MKAPVFRQTSTFMVQLAGE